MLIFRWLLFFLFLACALSFVFYLGTGKAYYRRWAVLILKWTVIAGLCFFAVMIFVRFI